MERLYWRLLVVGGSIATVLLIATLGYIFIAGYPPFDAFYMAMTTMATVGYAEIRPLGQAGRIFNLFVIFFGVGVTFLAIGAITQTVIELELKEVFGKRRVRRMIEKLNNHFIVCGYGRVGRGAAAELTRSGASFVVVDRDEAQVEQAVAAGMLAFAADSTRDETLKRAGMAVPAG